MYSAAVVSSIGVGLGVKRLLEPFSKYFKGNKKLFLNFFVSYFAIAGAGFINCMLMRSNEMKEGISLVDQEGNTRGQSKIIGKKAVSQTALTRTILPVPPLLIPTLTFYLLEKKSMIPKNRAAKLILESTVLFYSMWLAVPLAVSLFPQKGEASVEDLEEEFHNLTDSHGNKVSMLYYNKGL